MEKYMITFVSIILSAIFWLMSFLVGVQIFTSEHQGMIWQNNLTLICLILAAATISYMAVKSVRIWQKSSQHAFQKELLIYTKQVSLASGVIFFLSLGILPMFYRWADLGDEPGLMLIGLAICLFFFHDGFNQY
ncbi:DUF2975 domain-containing protein [Enterococcus cecorum]|uniref:DUF2975 domain-containing protein n=1 Tax=Enterococcus cecorum TaxID=44008 RepID=UPI002ACA90BF|nr:DUF2975 domain-containing protein [Enterococcus cecorum]MDZ5501737.1 DUF2975 domain-containing protein [Enterococcus cecorum]